MNLEGILPPWPKDFTPQGPLIYESPGPLDFDIQEPEGFRDRLRAVIQSDDFSDDEKTVYMLSGEIYDNVQGTRKHLLGLE